MEQKLFTLDSSRSMQSPGGLSPLHLSPDGTGLALTVGGEVLVVDTTTQERREPFSSKGGSCNAQWSPDGRQLAAHVTCEDSTCLGIWQRETDEVRLLREVQVRTWLDWEVPLWTPNGRGIVVRLVPAEGVKEPEQDRPLVDDDSSGVTVFSYDPEAVKDPAAAIFPHVEEAHSLYSDLGYVDLATGQIRRLVKGGTIRAWRISPDSRSVAVMQFCPGDSEEWASHDLVIVPLNGTPPKRVATHIMSISGYSFNWSPDSRSIAYITFTEGPVFGGKLMLAPADGSADPRNLSGEDQIDLSGESTEDFPPVWSTDGKTIYALYKIGVWVFSLDGEQRRQINSRYWQRRWIQRPTSATVWPPDGRYILLIVRNPDTLKEGVVRLDLEREQSEPLTMDLQKCLTGFEQTLKMEGAPDGSTCYLVAEAAHHPPELWRFRTEVPAAERFCSFNPHLDELALGKSRLIKYKLLDGQKHEGALFFKIAWFSSIKVQHAIKQGVVALSSGKSLF